MPFGQERLRLALFYPQEYRQPRLGVYDGAPFGSTIGDPTVNHDGLHSRVSGDQDSLIISKLAGGRPTLA